MPAPGAKCPECILAANRQRQAAHVSADVHAEARAKSPEDAAARDTAVIDRLKVGPTAFDTLVALIPGDLSPAARESACRSTLLRLTAKKVVKISTEGYALA